MTSAKWLFWGDNITCRRGQRVLFQNLSFAVHAGNILHLTGPNGTGKTSLLRVMAGGLPLAAGEISEIPENSFLPADDRYLKSLETVLENIGFWAGVWNVPRARQTECLAAMKIEPLKNTFVRQLSAGQRRRLTLALMMMKKAQLWLLDEPFNALDADGVKDFCAVIRAHLVQGGAAVVASHQAFDLPATPLTVGGEG